MEGRRVEISVSETANAGVIETNLASDSISGVQRSSAHS